MYYHECDLFPNLLLLLANSNKIYILIELIN